MAISNFYIQPGAKDVFTGLTGAYNQGQDRERAIAADERAIEADEVAIQQQQLQMQTQKRVQELSKLASTGDTKALGELMSLDPRLAQGFQKLEDDRVEKYGAEKAIISKRAETDWLVKYKNAKTPEAKEALLQEALTDDFINIDEDDLGLDPASSDLVVDMRLRSLIGDKAYEDAYGDSTKGMTTKQKDFKVYQELKKTDPAAAEAFGSGAGFVKDDQKRVFQIIDGMKVFADGTEKPLGGDDQFKTDSMKRSISKNQAQNVLGKAKEYQTKAAGFATRLRKSIDGMEALIKGVNGPAISPARAAFINNALRDGSIANIALNSEEQQYMVHAKDALFAILRPETGAAITDSEMKQYSQIYLPQPGDSEATTKLKQKKLSNQFNALRYKAPRVYDATTALDKIIQSENKEPREAGAVITQEEYTALPAGSEYEIDGVKYIKGQ